MSNRGIVIDTRGSEGVRMGQDLRLLLEEEVINLEA